MDVEYSEEALKVLEQELLVAAERVRAKYAATPKGKINATKGKKKFAASEKGRTYFENYRTTSERKAARKKYMASPKGQAVQRGITQR
jgi:hypothetical protein